MTLISSVCILSNVDSLNQILENLRFSKLRVHFFTKIQSGFLIQKQIFHLFIKIKKWITDPNDPQQRWTP